MFDLSIDSENQVIKAIEKSRITKGFSHVYSELKGDEINKILNINCLDGLKLIPDDSINCCVTSPPYYGLRDYGTATYEGGDPNCEHTISAYNLLILWLF